MHAPYSMLLIDTLNEASYMISAIIVIAVLYAPSKEFSLESVPNSKGV